MNDTNKQRTGKFSKALFFMISITSILLITILLSILIEWLGIAFDWWHLEKHYHAKCNGLIFLDTFQATFFNSAIF